MNTTLYVGNLSFQTSEDSLRDHFSREGDVERVTIVLDRDTGRSRGFAFVTMANEQSAQQAMNNLQGMELDGRALKLNEARPREEGGDRPPRSFDGGGGGGGAGGFRGGARRKPFGGGGGGGNRGGGYGGGGQGGARRRDSY